VFVLREIGRNDPCPCGSGKKYKKCCMPRDEMIAHSISQRTTDSAEYTETSGTDHGGSNPEAENAFRRACKYMEISEFDKAARAFRSVIMLDRNHYKAMTELGRCLVEIGQREEACKCFEKALEINPKYVQAKINLTFCKENVNI